MGIIMNSSPGMVITMARVGFIMVNAEDLSLPGNAVPKVEAYLTKLQADIVAALEKLDQGERFQKDAWMKPSGGGGVSQILSKGDVFAKAGVNFSSVYGEQLPIAATDKRHALLGRHYKAMGISLVLHPENPYVPIVHANLRFFIAEKIGELPIWWFGGGFDLTPCYGFVEDCVHWHSVAKQACAPFGEQLYPSLKQACDDYFFLEHRQEARGIGGLFFDDFTSGGFENSFAFVQSIGNHFLEAYCPIVEKRKNHPYGAREKAFQRYRRGRYVEFNLIYDRGTRFGLQSSGRVESILMSLPPEVEWHYCWQPEAGSEEARLYAEFLPARDWLGLHPSRDRE